MADEYREVETTSWGNNLATAFMGLVLGVALFFGSFFVLFFNEGRVDLSLVAKTAVEISATSPNSEAVGKLVSTTGTLTSHEVLGDNLFLKPGKYIAVRREVQMYAWDEEKKTETTKNIGGSETKTTTYTYTKRWVDQPENSSSFKYRNGHENPKKSIPNYVSRVKAAKVGVYNIEIANIELPTLNKIQLTEENIIFSNDITLAGDYLYKGTGSLQSPKIGDLRLEYLTLPNEANVTVFGKLESSNQIAPYIHKSNARLYRLFSGTRDKAISTLKTEHTIWTWIWRGIGFVMMWMGLAIAGEPISAVLDFIPLLGSVSRGVGIVSSFLIAFVLSSVTILLSMLVHNIVALAIAVVVAVAVMLVFRKQGWVR